MPRYIDLHMHTNLSDGVLAPPELLSLVRKAGLLAFSVTDHDTISGWREMSALVGPDDPELITGTELSVRIGEDDVHLLAYLFDPNNAEFVGALDFYQMRRTERGEQIVARLQNLGLDVTFEQVKVTAGGGVIGRPHIAATLFRLGLTKQYEEAFYKYIGYGKPAFVPKYLLAPDEACRLVHAAGGIVSLAHPTLGDMWRHVESLAAAGLDGIEAQHYSHGAADTKRARQMAERFGLIVTGGSDFHGRGIREAPLGSLAVPPAYLDRMKERAKTYRRTS
jgi:3',5'-nucleoside bisphosphate phosphatase